MRPKDMLNREELKAVERAERLDGYRYGALLHNGRQCFAYPTFYPRRRWWVKYLDGEIVPMTRRLDAELTRLVL